MARMDSPSQIILDVAHYLSLFSSSRSSFPFFSSRLSSVPFYFFHSFSSSFFFSFLRLLFRLFFFFTHSSSVSFQFSSSTRLLHHITPSSFAPLPPIPRLPKNKVQVKDDKDNICKSDDLDISVCRPSILSLSLLAISSPLAYALLSLGSHLSHSNFFLFPPPFSSLTDFSLSLSSCVARIAPPPSFPFSLSSRRVASVLPKEWADQSSIYFSLIPKALLRIRVSSLTSFSGSFAFSSTFFSLSVFRAFSLLLFSLDSFAFLLSLPFLSRLYPRFFSSLPFLVSALSRFLSFLGRFVLLSLPSLLPLSRFSSHFFLSRLFLGLSFGVSIRPCLSLSQQGVDVSRAGRQINREGGGERGEERGWEEEDKEKGEI
ncbi:hypothetical protein C7M84_015531 [Penaeus vannamei]|uniref:Transmembrane protein n=1 Tax=Penaeus vannamei TaxID=6689 RepID=A0A3R7SM01_PENVA|nr:hypothetical protein C7M84_015531 [Penaeus vannamei]